MRRIITIILLVTLIITGCAVVDSSDKQQDVSIDVADNQANQQLSVDSEGYKNEYFFNKETSSFSLKGGMYFNDWGDVEVPHKTVDFVIDTIAVMKEGYLSHISIKQFEEYPIPENRTSIGYFYITKDKIIRLIENKEDPWHISDDAIESFKKDGSLPAESLVVCQNESIEDKLKPDYKKGWHTYLDVRKNNTKFGMYQNTVTKKYKESYFWEHFYWKKGKGLVGYDCGYKAGVDYFDLGEVDD